MENSERADLAAGRAVLATDAFATKPLWYSAPVRRTVLLFLVGFLDFRFLEFLQIFEIWVFGLSGPFSWSPSF